MGFNMGKNRPSVREMRREMLRFCLEEAYPGGKLNTTDYKPFDFFRVTRGELEFAAVAAAEWVDVNGPAYQDPRLPEVVFTAMENAVKTFLDDAAMGRAGDGNSTYFALVPMTMALVKLREGGGDESRIAPLVEKCVWAFDTAMVKRPPVLGYFNPRALEAVAALGLYQLTGRQDFMDVCESRMKTILAVQFACGAQPYHIAGWIWGRRPSQVYQLLSAAMMLYVNQALKWPEVDGYVQRMMDYELVSMTPRGDTFQSCFEGLYKISQGACSPWQWPLALAMDDAKYLPMAGAAYDRWLEVIDTQVPVRTAGRYLDPVMALLCMHLVGPRELPERTERFEPAPGVTALKDISSVFVHEKGFSASMTVFTGYSAWIEGDCGDAKLLALGPELTDSPTYRNFGTDPLRMDWKVASEQDQCEADGGKAVLKGRGFTKWESPDVLCKDVTKLHARHMGVTMVYENGVITLDYKTLEDKGSEPVSERILLLLGVFPWSAQGRLRIGGQTWETPAAATPADGYRFEAPIGVVEMGAPDGSRIEVEPGIPGARQVVVERPIPSMRDGLVVKPANDGFLRVSFEGSGVLKEGRVIVRFYPGRG